MKTEAELQKLLVPLSANVMNDELLDNDTITNHTIDITYRNGMSFVGMTRFTAGAFLIIGFSVLFTGLGGFFLGLLMIGGGGFVVTSNYGTDICLSTKYVREYHQVFFIKTGKWRTSAPYTDICITKIGKSATKSDITGANSTNIDVSRNEVYLMTSDHRKRFLLKACK